MTDALVWLILVFPVVSFGAWGFLAWRNRRALAKTRRAIDQWRASQPPIIEPSAEQIAAFVRQLPQLALPALALTADDAAPVSAGGTRVGGPVWLADGIDWPTGKGGRALEFVAQLDFAAMPALPDYPQTGLLQLFVGRDDLHGVDFDAPDTGDIRLLWHPDGAQGGRLVPPPRLPAYGSAEDDGYSSTPFIDARVRETGTVLRGQMAKMHPQSSSRPVEALCAALSIDIRASAVAPLLDTLDDSLPEPGHFVGGHPMFVQDDYRLDVVYPPRDVPTPSPWRDYDRLLFQLSSSTGLQWGDVGEGNVMVRRADLLARDFSRAIFWWDCS